MLAKEDYAYFIAKMGHELRTPLNSIKGFTDLLLHGYAGSLEAKQIDYLNKILFSSEKLLDIVNQIVDWAKIDSGQEKISLEVVNISSLLKEVISLLEYQGKEKNINLKIEDDSQNKYFLGDMVKIRQVLLNLGNNAIKFTPQGGQIILGSRFLKQDNLVQFFIKDNGVGIPQEKLSLLFNPFTRLNNKVNNDGHGLGLWICKIIIKIHKGEIWIESEEGQGTTVFFNIPRGTFSKKAKG